MPVSVTMPRLGESVTEGTVTRWLKQEGDRVEADEPLLEVSTDKVDTEIPSPASGVLSRIVVGEDETVEVGSELAVIAGDGESGGRAQAPPTEDEVQGAAESSQPEAQAPEPSESAPVDESPPVTAEASTSAPSPASTSESSSDGSSGGGSSAGEPTAVKMPALGESVTEGTVTRWLKQVGDRIDADEPLVEISTDKVDTEIPSPVAGILLEIKAAEDDVVPVGGDLALIGAEGAAPPPAASAQATPAPTQSAPSASAPSAAPPAEKPPAPKSPEPAPRSQPARAPSTPAPAASEAGSAGEPDNGYVTPLVRKLASQHGVDLATLVGTGVGGRIRKQDVLEAAEKAKAPVPQEAPAAPAAPERGEPSPLRGRTEKLSRLRAVIAKRMVESLQTSAQLSTVVEVDVTRIAKLRDQAKAEFQARNGVKLSFLPFFALATVEALRVHPMLNASLDVEAGTVTYHDAEHLGIAVDTERGLVVPVIRDAGDLNLAGLSKRIADLAERTRTNKISPDDLQGGTFTLTNTGSRGALFDTPIINQPQVGILGTGSVVRRAVVVDDADLGEIIATRSMVYLSLTYDHRLVDGADAARFLGTLKERLEGGAFENELGL
jgi:pyruvate dehydrogenase E2 component (dihydrolipoamide acetyltransferase)